MQRAVVLWTGGKESWLALCRAREQGINIMGLATFVPASGREFLAHPQPRIREQARYLGLDVHFIAVDENNVFASYVAGLQRFRQALGLSAVVTGDIDQIDQQPNWIETCCGGIGLSAIRPLWNADRMALMKEMLARGIQAEITYINSPLLSQCLVGTVIDESTVRHFAELARVTNFDICGENGEYHTMVMHQASASIGTWSA